jgi:hypothetical protein
MPILYIKAFDTTNSARAEFVVFGKCRIIGYNLH